jgi:hypothetical protein
MAAASELTGFDRSKLKKVSHLTVVKTAASFMVVDKSPDEKLHLVVKGLYIGSQDAAANAPALAEQKVTHILNAASASTIPPAFPGVRLFCLKRATVGHEPLCYPLFAASEIRV